MSEDPEAPKRTVFIRPEDRQGAPTPPPAPPPQDAVAPQGFQPAPLPPQAAPARSSPTAARFGEVGSLVGATLNDNYEVTRYITQGGMGEIYEGRQIRGNAKVAIKVILPQFAADPEFYTLLEREADLLAQLGHDAIVKFRGLSQDRASGVDYLTLEYVQGPSLEDRMDDGPVEPLLCRALLRRLASGLDAAHDKGVYHRDLSPDNILLRDGRIERATIIDFGIAKDTDTSKKTVIGAGFGGKLGFAAPEAFGLFGREIGPWTDIYSLALVVAAAARARVIDMGTATPIDAIEARRVVPPLDGVEPWLATVLARMLAPDPANRLHSMSDVIAAVDALPPVGTPFEAEADAAPVAPAFVRAEAPPPVATFGRLDADPETTDLKLVRADTITPMAPPPAKSRLPLYIGGGVLVAALAGAGFFFAGGDKTAEAPAADIEIAAAPTQAPTPGPTPAAPAAAPDWATARAALAAIPCSDIRAAPPSPGATTLAVSGWMAAGTAVPATAGGYRLDTAALNAINPGPSAETCATAATIKAAMGDAGVLGALKLAPATSWVFADLKKSGANYLVPNGLAGTGKPLFLVNIEDRPTNPAQAVFSTVVPARTPAFPTDSSQPVRYLQFFLSAAKLPGNGSETGNGAAVGAACTAGCTSTSGWVIVK